MTNEASDPTTSFTTAERARAVRWKRSSSALPDSAREPAPFRGRGGTVQGSFPFCLPLEHAELNLLPEVRAVALELFEELGIPWHPAGDRPSNHLLSSQVQCVNALGAMVTDPDRIVLCFRPILGTSEVEAIEPGRFLTFEYIGPTDYFGEVPGGGRVRGSMCTSVDAAFVHRTTHGVRELVLIEWKYTEHYPPRRQEPAKDETRRHRYEPFLTGTDSPVRSDVLPFDAFLQEPLYQLMRQQLLAHELQRQRVLDVDSVRVVHVCPRANDRYQQSLGMEPYTAVGATTSDVWAALLATPDRFVSVDNGVFLDPSVTSAEYVDRYGGDVS